MRSEGQQVTEGHTMDREEPVSPWFFSQDSALFTMTLIAAHRAVGPWICLPEEAGLFQVAFVCLEVLSPSVTPMPTCCLGLETQVCRRGEENFQKNGHTG